MSSEKQVPPYTDQVAIVSSMEESTELPPIIVDQYSPPQSTKCIDVRMIPTKACYFLHDAKKSTMFLVVFLTSVGLSVKEAGVILGVRLLVSLIGTPLLGYLVDYTGRTKTIFAALCIAAALTHFPLPWVAASMAFPATNTTNFEIGNITGSSPVHHGKPFTSQLFYATLMLISISATCMSPLPAFINSFVMNIISTSKIDVDFGKQRLFGAVGSAICSVATGLAIDHYNPIGLSEYTASFLVYLPLALLLIPAGLITASQTKPKAEPIESAVSKNKFKILMNTFSDFSNILFIVSVIIAGVGRNAYKSYLFQLMEDQMHAKKLTMGLANFVAGIAEIVILFFSKHIMKVIGGPFNGIMLVLFSYAVQFMLLSFITNEWLVLPTQIFHGITFSIFSKSAAEYTHGIASEEVYTTVFTVVLNCYMNLGGLLACFVGGFIYEHFSGKVLYLGLSLLCGAWVVIATPLFHFVRCGRKGEMIRSE